MVNSMQLNKIMANPRYVWVSIALLIAVFGVIYLIISSGSQAVVKGDTIQVYYTGRLTNGTVFDSNVGRQPLNFTVGSGQLIKGFDEGVIGMKINETRNITIPVNEAYGEINPNLIINVPLNVFGNKTVSVGNVVTRTSNGQQYQGTVISINATDATINFNSPLAGKILIFNIRVVGIQKKQ
jgi:FKBP-type peptidyl-prolyl cis-trans isomerase 2